MKDNLNSKGNSLLMNFNTRDIKELHITNYLNKKKTTRKPKLPQDIRQTQDISDTGYTTKLYENAFQAPVSQSGWTPLSDIVSQKMFQYGRDKYDNTMKLLGNDNVDVGSQIQEFTRGYSPQYDNKTNTSFAPERIFEAPPQEQPITQEQKELKQLLRDYKTLKHGGSFDFTERQRRPLQPQKIKEVTTPIHATPISTPYIEELPSPQEEQIPPLEPTAQEEEEFTMEIPIEEPASSQESFTMEVPTETKKKPRKTVSEKQLTPEQKVDIYHLYNRVTKSKNISKKNMMTQIKDKYNISDETARAIVKNYNYSSIQASKDINK